MKKRIVFINIIILVSAIFFLSCSANKEIDIDEQFIKKDLTECLGLSPEKWEEKLESINFKERYPEYTYQLSNDDVFEGISIANYDLSKFTKADKLQEVFEYGNLYGTESDSEKYIQISIIENDNNYSLDINYETGERINEIGEFFLEGDKEQYIDEKVRIIKEIIN